MTRRTWRTQPPTLCEAWAVHLGVDPATVTDELEARFGALLAAVTSEPPAPGSTEAAVAHCDLWAVSGFIADAHRVLSGQEVTR